MKSEPFLCYDKNTSINYEQENIRQKVVIMMLENNVIPWKKRMMAVCIDYLVICGYLIVLFLVMMAVYFGIFKEIPPFTERQSQMIALVASVIPAILMFTWFDYHQGTPGRNKAGLFLYFQNKNVYTCLLRNIVKFLPWQLGHYGTIRGMYTNFDGIAIAINILSILLLVTMFVTGFFRKDKRHLADLVAGTQVQMK